MGIAVKEQKCFAHLTKLYLTDYNEGKGAGEGKGPTVSYWYLFCPHKA